MSESTEKVELELMWEAIESFYFAYSNGWTYLKKLDGWHPYVELTHLLDFKGRSVRCYLDRNEMVKASKASLKNFLDPEWVARFSKYSNELLEASQKFIEETHLRSSGIEKEVLLDRVRRGTTLLYDTLLAFMITQPQYSWEVEPHLFTLMNDIKAEDKRTIVSTLAQSSNPTFLSEEEDMWAKLMEDMKQKHESVPTISDESTNAVLTEHARLYGLVRAADAQAAWDLPSLYERLVSDWNRTDLQKDREGEREKLQAEQNELIEKYTISPEVVRICEHLRLLSHLRLETRLRGWMPLEKIVINELIPELTRFIPYTATQLESCTPDELSGLIDGVSNPTPEELDIRAKHVVVGIYKGKEVMWLGEEIEENMAPILPKIDYNSTELSGQPATKGKVRGTCHVISWEEDLSATQIDEMPQGAVLIAGQTRPQLMGAIKKASAIVTDEGGILSHAAIVSRELRIPCVIGTKYATKIFKSGDMVEVDADNGVVRKL